MFISNGSVSISDSMFANNSDRGAGGAIYAVTSGFSNTISLTRSTFVNNLAGDRGGAALLWQTRQAHNGSITVSQCTFINNIGSHNPESGGALFMYAHTVTSMSRERSNFTGNRGTFRGGAVYMEVLNGDGHMSLKWNNFLDNRATAGAGRAVRVTGGSTLLDHNNFHGNLVSLDDVGAVSISSLKSSVVISSCSFTNNGAIRSFVGALGVGAVSCLLTCTYACTNAALLD